jgi:nicotinate-nucleotide pyrophosphorylase (carboxylating)
MDDFDRFLAEDLDKKGDITSDALFSNEQAQGIIMTKEPCVLAGVQEIMELFKRVGEHPQHHVNDGDYVKANTTILTVQGQVKNILKTERLALNFLGRMSGIATQTKHLVDQCQRINPHVTIAATRKTTPGFRKYEKKAVVLGGGEAHRMGLYDAVMIKDNHLNCVESLEYAIEKVFEKNLRPIEVEVENEQDALQAASYPIDVIMLDNFPPDKAQQIAQKIRENNNNILIEISGGITPNNIEHYAPFADRISLGFLTHSVKNIDFSLTLQLI